MTRQTRVGLLVIAAFGLFFIALFAIANRTFLFSETFILRSEFNRVAGLQAGGAVQYQGVNVGRVEAVQLPRIPGAKIVVTMAITQSARHVVRKNTLAQIKSEGLVGEQIIVLVSPPVVGDPVADEDTIPGVDPFDLFEITDKALVSVQNFEKAANTFEQIMLDVKNGQGTLGKIIYDSTLYYSFISTALETQRVLNSLADNAEAFVALAGDATTGLEGILQKVEGGEGTASRLLNDPQLYDTWLASSDSLRAIMGDMRVVMANIENTSNWGSLGAFRFAELMEAAKHNWLFKRYFEERGHMEQAPFEVRERALEETYRKLSARERELFEWEERLKAMQEDHDGASEATQPDIRTSSTPNDQ